VIEELVRAKSAALGVRGTISAQARQIAQNHHFPLIALSDRAPLPQVERAVQRLLTSRQSQMAQRAFEIQQMLQRHAANYRGLTTMLNVLARIVDRPVVIYDRQGMVLSRGLPASREQEWETHPALADGTYFIERANLHRGDISILETPAGLLASLTHDGRALGYVAVLSAGEAPDDFDRMALEYSLPTLVREMIRQQAADLTVETSVASRDWITDWLNSPMSDDILLTRRAEQDSYSPDTWYAAVLFHWIPPHDWAKGSFLPDRMVKLIRTEMAQRRIQAPVGQHVDRAVLLFPLDEPQQTQRLKQMVDLLHGVLGQAAGEGEITAGVGRPAIGLTSLRESFREAERSLTLSEQIWDQSQVAFFGEFSLYELLLGVTDPAILSGFCERWLFSLMEYDREHNTDLLPTLDAYFANNGNMARTAHVLNIHRNTLVYRLTRITEIMQLDMDDANVRLNLQLALKVHRMLSATGDKTDD
jgi:PucR family transcriptional regulator, purine catabolism regulatory protein